MFYTSMRERERERIKEKNMLNILSQNFLYGATMALHALSHDSSLKKIRKIKSLLKIKLVGLLSKLERNLALKSHGDAFVF